jgi:unsaturated rhamnogalacturonyl hydrolase
VTQTLPLLALLAAAPAAPAAAPAPTPPAAAAAPAPTPPPPITVKVTNPLSAARTETVSITIAELKKLAPTLDAAKTVVVDDKRKPILSQLIDGDGDDVPDELVFQTDLAAGANKTFTVEAGTRAPFKTEDFRVYGRFVRERHDDISWENDRVAHRMYGKDLETWKKEPLTSSGIDVWSKRAKRLVINDWYMTDDYHRDNGEGGDFYSVGKSRGCGGIALVLDDKAPAQSRNFTSSRVFAQGPIRLVFELTYDPYEAGAGVKVTETKRISLDAGKSFNRVASRFKLEGKASHAAVAVGIAKHAGADLKTEKTWMRSWEPLKDDNGSLGCAVVLAPGAGATSISTTDLDTYLVARTNPTAPFVYYTGSDWSKRGGSVTDAASWTKAVQEAAKEIASPVKVTLSVKK